MSSCFRWAGMAVLAVVFAYPTVNAQTYSHYFDVPGNVFLHDLTFHDGYVWAADRSSATGPRIIKIDPDNGQFVETITLNVEFSITGLTWDGDHFWVSRTFTSSNNRIYKIDPATGNVVDDIPAPSPLTNGLAWHDGFLWASRANPNDQAAHVRLNPTDGTELQAIPSPWTQPAGMAFIGDGTFWATNAGDDGTNIEKLYQIELATGDMLQDLDMPAGIGRPRGLAYDGAGTLYMIAQTRPGATNYRMYVIDLGSEGNPALSYAPQQLNFGFVITGTSDDLSVTLSNTGDADLVVDNVNITGSATFSTGFTGAVVPPNENVQLPVTFSPTEYSPYQGTLTFNTNAVAHPTVSIPLSGHGLYPEETLGATASEHNFGAVRIENPYGGERAVRTWPLGVVNEGDGTLTVTGLAVEEPFTIEQEVNFPFTVAAADTVYILVGFRPTETGTFSDEAVLTAEDARQTLTIDLFGTGTDPEVTGGDPLWTLTVPDNPEVGFQDKKVPVIRSMGDVTGDGTPDLAVGARNYLVMGVRGNSWETGEILWSFNTCTNNFNCGAVNGVDGLFDTGLVAGMDLNGDGYGDVVFGTGGGNDHVYALSGKDGSVIWAHGDVSDPYLASYYAVQARYDFNGDGIPDVAAVTGTASQNSPNPYNQRRVYLLSGATGEVIWVRQPSALLPYFGVEQIRNADGDLFVVAGGAEDPNRLIVALDATGTQVWTHTPSTTPFLIKAFPREDGGEDIIYTGGSQTSNELTRLNGDTGEVVWSIAGLTTIWSLDFVHNVTANGAPGVVVGTHQTLNSGFTMMYDSEDGSFVWASGPYGQVFGVAAMRDITGNAVGDVAIAASDSRVHLLNGANGEAVWTYVIGNGQISQAAEQVSIIPDVDGNNAPQIAAGTRHGRVALLASTGDVLPVDGEPGAAPGTFAFHVPYPNPARGSSHLVFDLPEAQHTRVEVFDLLGRRVAVLLDSEQQAGRHELEWSGRDGSGTPVAAGLYLVRIEAGSNSATQRVMRLR